MFYRNPYVNKPKGAVWSDTSNASQILVNEFFGATTTPHYGKIKIGGAFVELLGEKIKVGGTFVDALGYKVKVGGVFVDVV